MIALNSLKNKDKNLKKKKEKKVKNKEENQLKKTVIESVLTVFQRFMK